MTHQASSARRHRAGRPGSRHRGVIGITAAIGLVITGASGVWAAAPNRSPATLAATPSATPSASASGPGASTNPLGYDPDDTGGLSAITRIVGAQQAWADGWTGSGVDVAVIDTGVARVPGLDADGQVITGPDLSFDSPDPALTGRDAYGHGTFMAGLIAGRDAGAGPDASGCTTCLNSSGFSDTTRFVGVAPQARIVDVKVGAADGAVDVSQVIAAVDWVTQHAHDPGINIKVLSLSYGTDTVQQYDRDPLAQAVEQAWKHGVLVVVAAGADDPLGTLATSDDRVPDFAQHGTRTRPVDVVAPGTHVVGLRVPGSFVDTLAGNTGQLGTRFQRGSGTSQATAIVAGAAALLAQKYPTATPDTIKGLLDGSARLLPRKPGNDNTAELYSGHGVLDVAGALAATPAPSTQTWGASTGAGDLDKSRAGEYVASNGVDLRGERDIFGHAFDSTATAAAQSQARAWTGGLWNGSRWTGDGWDGSRWTGSRWTGSDWAGSRWTGSRWTGMTWDGSRWTGAGWSGSRWTGSRWTGIQWSTADWG